MTGLIRTIHFLALAIIPGIVFPALAGPDYTIDQVSPNKVSIIVTITPEPDATIFKDSLIVHTNSPKARVEEWKPLDTPAVLLDTKTGTKKKVFNTTFRVNAIVSGEIASAENLKLIVSYRSSAKEAPIDLAIPFEKPQANQSVESYGEEFDWNDGGGNDDHERSTTSNGAIEPSSEVVVESLTPNKSTKTQEIKKTQPLGFKEKISKIFIDTESWWLRLLIALLLGLLMSLTPCLYPMIPITAGVLHNQAGNSVLKNALTAMTYVLGICTTFAAMGIIAATTGRVLGSFISHPIVIIFIVLSLAYMGLSMLGLYEMRMPKFLSGAHRSSSEGRGFFSTFLLGAASGTIASPCLSPGLALLLSIVATVGNYVYGFLLLLAFGLGLGFPLVIVGTFSGSLANLPKAGGWMSDVKRLFGLLILLVCFYHLNALLPLEPLRLLGALTAMALGAYLIHISTGTKRTGTPFTLLLGVAMVAGSVFLGLSVARDRLLHPMAQAPSNKVKWIDTYTEAKDRAIQSNKMILVDFYTKYCGICKLIDKDLLQSDELSRLNEQLIFAKIDCATEMETGAKELANKVGLVGVPLLVLMDPYSGKILGKWSGELYGKPPSEFVLGIRELLGSTAS